MLEVKLTQDCQFHFLPTPLVAWILQLATADDEDTARAARLVCHQWADVLLKCIKSLKLNSERQLEMAVRQLPSVVKLELCGEALQSPKAIEGGLQGFVQLRELCICVASLKVVPDLMAMPFSYKLRRLVLEHIPLIDCHMLAMLPSLEALKLVFIDDEMAHNFEPLSKLRHLTQLTISGLYDMQGFCKLTQLVELDLDCCTISADWAQLSRLQKLVAKHAELLGASAAPTLGLLEKLEHIDLSGAGAVPQDISALPARLTHLSWAVRFEGPENLGDLSLLRKFQRLRTLSLEGMEVEGLHALQHLTALQELKLSGEQVAFHGLQQAGSLQKLDVKMPCQETVLLPSLTALTTLRVLSIESYLASQCGKLQDLPASLLELCFKGCDLFPAQFSAPLTQLPSLRSLAITGADLSAVNLPSTLEALELRNVNFTAEEPGLAHLSALTSLVFDWVASGKLLGLAKLVGLIKLSITDWPCCPVTVSLKQMSRLAHLALTSRRPSPGNLWELPPVSAVKGLTHLELDASCRFSVGDTFQLSRLTKLRSLSTVENSLEEFRVLSQLVSLPCISRVAVKKRDCAQKLEALLKERSLNAWKLVDYLEDDFYGRKMYGFQVLEVIR